LRVNYRERKSRAPQLFKRTERGEIGKGRTKRAKKITWARLDGEGTSNCETHNKGEGEGLGSSKKLGAINGEKTGFTEKVHTTVGRCRLEYSELTKQKGSEPPGNKDGRNQGGELNQKMRKRTGSKIKPILVGVNSYGGSVIIEKGGEVVRQCRIPEIWAIKTGIRLCREKGQKKKEEAVQGGELLISKMNKHDVVHTRRKEKIPRQGNRSGYESQGKNAQTKS